MAAVANITHQKRTRPRGLVPADISGHHRPEAAHRNGRQQRRSLQVRQARQISYQIEIGSSFSVQLPFAGFERHNCTDYHQTIAFGSCESLWCFIILSKLKIFVLIFLYFCHTFTLLHIILLIFLFVFQIFIFKICISIPLTVAF